MKKVLLFIILSGLILPARPINWESIKKKPVVAFVLASSLIGATYTIIRLVASTKEGKDNSKTFFWYFCKY